MADIAFVHAQYEAESYYTMAYRSMAAIDEEWGFRWRYILRKIAGQMEPINNLLDVGAGNGYFVSLARKEFGIDATGLEISRKETTFARDVFGVKLIQEDVRSHLRQYDIVTSFNVIEHVVDPRTFFEALVDRVRPGGLVAVTTPSPACIHAKLHGLRRWEMISPPHHINLLTRASLESLTRATGLKILSHETLSTYINCVRKFDSERLFLRRSAFHMLRIFGLGADHFIVARKPAH